MRSNLDKTNIPYLNNTLLHHQFQNNTATMAITLPNEYGYVTITTTIIKLTTTSPRHSHPPSLFPRHDLDHHVLNDTD